MAHAVDAGAAALQECVDARRSPPHLLIERWPHGDGFGVPAHVKPEYVRRHEAIRTVHERARAYADAVTALVRASLSDADSL
jgi:hypothetical protein